MHSSWPFISALVGLAAGFAVSIPAARGDAKAPTIGVNEIKEGMKGYGLSVFHGTEPERFDVEVIGVLHNFRPSQELILIKTPNNARLDVAKTVHGMSGSPIYLDGGRLAGAYSYSYSNFPAEPVAGVTPIAPMLAELHRPVPPGFWPVEGSPPLPSVPQAPGEPIRHAGATSFDGGAGGYDLEAHAAQIASRLKVDGSSGLVPNATPLMLSGMGERTAAFVRKLMEPLGLDALQAGGSSGEHPAPGAPEHFVDGGTLGVQLVSGDLSIMGMGTVTHVEGRRLCGFGHPMFEAGNTALPTSIARVLWIHAGVASSSKIGETVRQVGALVQDRMSSVIADESKAAPMFPVTVELRGLVGDVKRTWNTRVADERFLSPSLAASVLGGAVEASASERRDVTWRLDSRLTVRGHGTIALEDYGVAIGGMPDSGDFGHARVVRAIGDVINNPWERASIEKVESVLTVRYARELWRLRGVDALESVVDAGSSARLVLHLVPFVGREVTKTIDVKMPEELAGKDVELEIVPGYEVVPEAPAPESLPELLANETRQSVTPKSVVVQFKTLEQGVMFGGHVAPRLPPFALDALRPAHSDVGPEPFVTYARTVVPLDEYVEGHDKVKVRVRAVVR
jgi:hypothetical protein